LLSSMSDPGLGSIEVNDKLVHFVLYAVLGVTLSHARTSGRSADRADGHGQASRTERAMNGTSPSYRVAIPMFVTCWPIRLAS